MSDEIKEEKRGGARAGAGRKPGILKRGTETVVVMVTEEEKGDWIAAHRIRGGRLDEMVRTFVKQGIGRMKK